MRFKKLILVFFLVFSGIPAFSTEPKPMVRVLVLENVSSISLTVNGEYQIYAHPSGTLLKKGRGLRGVVIKPSLQGVRLGKEEFTGDGIRIQPQSDRDLFLNQSRFRGGMDFWKRSSVAISAVNRIDIESYLYGVLHHEVGHWWPMEALKAQAIAARTYALYQMSVSGRGEYDLKSSNFSQVYGGSTTERFRTRRAVDQTAGEVLAYGGKIFPAYFHATCGGKTAGAQELWKMDAAPLQGGVSCGYCKISPHLHWSAAVPLSEIEEKMFKNGRPVGQITHMEIMSQTPSGRVGSLKITGISGEMLIAAKDFRIWVGGDKIRSTRFEIRLVDDMAEFQGRGWGHGVGLCQWGALGASLLGHTHEEILKLYYPGAEIEDYLRLRP